MHSKTHRPLIPFRSAGYPSPKDWKTKSLKEITSQCLPWKNSCGKPTSCAVFRPRRCLLCCAFITILVSYFTTTAFRRFPRKSSRMFHGSSRLRRHCFIRSRSVTVTTMRSSSYCTITAFSLKASLCTSGPSDAPRKPATCHLLSNEPSSSISTRVSTCSMTPERRSCLQEETLPAMRGSARLLSTNWARRLRRSQSNRKNSTRSTALQIPMSKSRHTCTLSATKASTSFTPNTGNWSSSAFVSSTSKTHHRRSFASKALECQHSSTDRLVSPVTLCFQATTCASPTSTKAWSWSCCARQPPSKRTKQNVEKWSRWTRSAPTYFHSSRASWRSWRVEVSHSRCCVAWVGVVACSQTRHAGSIADAAASLPAASTLLTWRMRFLLVLSVSARRRMRWWRRCTRCGTR